MIRALIFDFDGLILDTESTVYQSWVELYQEYGQELPFEEWGQIIGVAADEHFDPLKRLESRLNTRFDDVIGERRHQREMDLVLEQPILPGVQDYLLDAKRLGLKLAIASSSDYEWVGWHLRRLELIDFFDVIHTADDVQHTKPSPDLYLLALESLGVSAGETIVFEDSPNGVKAAQRAGIFCVVVPNPLTRLLSVDHADLCLSSLAEAPLELLLEKVENTADRN